VVGGACVGNPCDIQRNTIGWGWSRETYGLEEQGWQTPMLCFEEMMLETRAREHFDFINSDILRPLSKMVVSTYILRKAMELADTKICVSPG
jgi:hypothetical protein